jgi:hypothetical protein
MQSGPDVRWSAMKSNRTVQLLSAVAMLAAASESTCVLAAAPETNSEGISYVLSAGASYTDNVARAPSQTAEGSGAMSLGALLRGEKTTGRLRYDVAAEYSQYAYFTGDTDTAGFGRGQLSGRYDIVPDAFRWEADLSFDQQRADPVRPLAPGNVDGLTRISTGPTLQAQLFGAFEAVLDARYSRADYGNSPYDNSTVGARAQLQRRANPRSSWGVGASYEDVSYAGASSFDFRREEAFLSATLHGVRTDLQAEAGVGRVKSDVLDQNNPMFRVRLTRQMSPFLNLYVSYSDEYPTSAGANLAENPVTAGGSVHNPAVLTAAPRNAQAIEVGFNVDRPRSSAQLGVVHTDETSLLAGLGERKYDELRLRVTRLLTPASRVSVVGSYSVDEFSQVPRFSEAMYGFEYGMDFTRTIGVDARIEQRQRSGRNAPNLYTELAGGLFLRYTGNFRQPGR